MVRARVDQFEAAAPAVGPFTPPPASPVSHLIHDDPCDIRLRDARRVGVDHLVRHRQSQPFPAAGQFAAEISQGVVRVQIGIMGDEIGGVVRNHEIIAGRHRRVGREDVADAGDELPAADVYGAAPFIVQLHISIVDVAGDRFAHDLIDDNVAHQNAAVRSSRRPSDQRIKIVRAVRIPAHRDSVLLAFKLHRVENSRSVRCFEVNAFARRAEAEAQLVFIE